MSSPLAYGWMVDVLAGFAFTVGAAYWLLDIEGRDLRDE